MGGGDMKSNFLNKSVFFISFGLLAGCGSGGGGGGNEVSTTPVTGSVFASFVDGASVSVEDAAGNTVAAPVPSNQDGTYIIYVPNDKLSQDLVFKSSGGTFTDEATGTPGVTGGGMGAYVAGGTLGANAEVHITPSSTIVQKMITEHGVLPADAKSGFESGFGYADEPALAPLDATSPPAAGASEEGLRAGLRNAAFSQLAMDLGISPDEQFQVLSRLAEDLTDGLLNGVPGQIEEDIQNRYERALIGFSNGPRNKTGLKSDEIGVLPFARVALTEHYRVEYIAGMNMMGAMEGKTAFSLNITDPETDLGVSNLTVQVKPTMHMSMMTHGTPVEGCVESSTAGRYDCTVYYLMASAMADGTSMGYWELALSIHEGAIIETAYLYPKVMMAMGVRTVLKGQADMIPGMGMDTSEPRTYYLFKESLIGDTFNLYIAARENMMNYPPVFEGAILNQAPLYQPIYQLDVASMTVEISTDKNTWVQAEDHGDGHWSASGLTGLDGEIELYVRLTVNGEQKTTNGNAPAEDGSNAYGIFIVTPQ
jgi:hypothetical protein